MALIVDFAKNPTGLAAPEAYTKIESLSYSSKTRQLDMTVAFFANQAARLDCVETKREALSEEIEALKLFIVGLEATAPEPPAAPLKNDSPEILEEKKAAYEAFEVEYLAFVDLLRPKKEQLAALYSALENATGAMPLCREKFSFRLTNDDLKAFDFMSLAYQKLKTVEFTGKRDGVELACNFTESESV